MGYDTIKLCCGPLCAECETGIVKTEDRIRALEAEKADADARLHGAMDLVRKAAAALKSASVAIQREAWQDGPSIAKASSDLLDAAQNIEHYGPEGFANALKQLRTMIVAKMEIIARLEADRAALLAVARAACDVIDAPLRDENKAVMGLQAALAALPPALRKEVEG